MEGKFVFSENSLYHKTMICWKCGKETSLEKIFRNSECPFCFVDLHSCKACDFYSPGNHFECKENVHENVTDKEKSNFCDFFRPSSKSTKNASETMQDKSILDKAALARKSFNALFGE